MSVTEARPDLAAHTHAMRASFPEVAAQLRELLGARLVAYLGGVRETRAVHQWADDERPPAEHRRPAAPTSRPPGRSADRRGRQQGDRPGVVPGPQSPARRPLAGPDAPRRRLRGGRAGRRRRRSRLPRRWMTRTPAVTAAAELAVLRSCGVPEPSGRRELRADPAGFDRLVEMVAPNAPLFADLVGVELAAPDPLANRLLLDLEQSRDLVDLEELKLGWGRLGHGGDRFVVRSVWPCMTVCRSLCPGSIRLVPSSAPARTG